MTSCCWCFISSYAAIQIAHNGFSTKNMSTALITIIARLRSICSEIRAPLTGVIIDNNGTASVYNAGLQSGKMREKARGCHTIELPAAIPIEYSKA